MKIGILSDTHGHIPRTGQAVEALRREGVDYVLHAGDIGAEGVLIELAAGFEPQAIPVLAVLGNVDAGDPALARFPESAGVRVAGWRADCTLDGLRFALLHGHDGRALRSAVESGSYHAVVTGHTHRFEDRREGPTRILNPGAVYRSPAPGVAVLDTRSQVFTHIPLPPL